MSGLKNLAFKKLFLQTDFIKKMFDFSVESPKSSKPVHMEGYHYRQNWLTEIGNLSTTPEENPKSTTTFENDDSDCSDYDTDDSFQEFKLKDWLKLAKTLVGKHETPQNKTKLAGKYDELQDFFYFFAVEYFTGDENVAELVNSKRNEFVSSWQDIIGPCDSIFDYLLDSISDINVENSFRL